MSEHPFHPQGFGQHGEAGDPIDRPAYGHIGKRIKFEDLPEDCKRLVLMDYYSIWKLPKEPMIACLRESYANIQWR
jgi:hypothetical protein